MPRKAPATTPRPTRKRAAPRKPPAVATVVVISGGPAADSLKVPLESTMPLANAALDFADARCCEGHAREALTALVSAALAMSLDVLGQEGVLNVIKRAMTNDNTSAN